MADEDAYREFFLNSHSSVVQIEVLTISHSAFSKTYRLVRNVNKGIIIDGNEYMYYPLSIRSTGARDDLDFGLNINLGDLGEVLPKEMDRVFKQNGFTEKPIIAYSVYSSASSTGEDDDGRLMFEASRVLYGPVNLEATNFSFNKEGASFEAQAPRLNISRTGRLYTLDRFPALGGFA